jgi:tRNA pseudouridine55 synthase
LAPMDTPLMSLNRVELGESASFYLKQGQPVLVPNGPRDGMVRVYSGGDSFLGIGEMLEDGRVAPRRLVNH